MSYNTSHNYFIKRNIPNCLVRVTHDAMKHHDQKQVEEERVSLVYTSIFLFIIKGSQD